MFGRKNEEEKPVQKEAQSWDDKLAAAMPQKSMFFDSIRTDAYENKNFIANYVEFWEAVKVDQEQDKWRIMHYMIFDLDKPDGNFKSEVLGKADASFPEAVYHMAKFETMANTMGVHTPVEMSLEKYPADKYPELKVHFFDAEHYKIAANIEGMALDEAGHPYRRVEGKVFATGTFKRSEIGRSILAVEQARENPKVAFKIEKGVLSDIFNSASTRNASLDEMIKGGESLACLDSFAVQMGAFYLGIQKLLGKNDKFDKVQSLSVEGKEAIYRLAVDAAPSDSPRLLSWLLPIAGEQLEKAKKLGVHVEPFQKHLAECELYTHLLQASKDRSKFQASMKSTSGVDMKALADMRNSVEKAKDKFLQLGGTMEHFDRLQAWVARDKKEEIPAWLPGWLDRYYDQRQKAMKKIQERTTGLRAVNTMSAKVKPPVIE